MALLAVESGAAGNSFDCESGVLSGQNASGRKENAPRKKFAICFSMVVAFGMAVMVGFCVLGPLAANITSNDHKLTKAFVPTASLAHAPHRVAAGMQSEDPQFPVTRRSGSPEMMHKDYFKRVAQADKGRLRLFVHRTNNHIYAGVADDNKHHIVASASSMEKELREKLPKGYGNNKAAAREVGLRIAAAAKAKGVEKVFFDRKGKKYHGRIAAVADGAREGGLDF